MQFYRSLMGEWKKRRRSFFMLLHIGIPVIFPVALIMYYLARNDSISTEMSYGIFFQLIAVGTPVITSIICGIVADLEKEAGQFQNILGLIGNRSISFLSQTTMMLVSYSISMLTTIFLYTLSLRFLVGVEEVNFTLYYLTGIIFMVTSTFQYIFYQVISYQFGIGSSSLWGFGGAIIAAFSFTSIGDKVWPFFPWALANRISSYVFQGWKGLDDSMFLMGIFLFVIYLVVMLIVSIGWINRWGGRQTND